MQIKAKFIVILLFLLAASGMICQACAAEPGSDMESLVEGFPTLDALEVRLGPSPSGRASDTAGRPNSYAFYSASHAPGLPAYPQLFAGPPAAFVLSTDSTDRNAQRGGRALAALLADLKTTEKETADLTGEITRKNNLVRNRYFFDCLTTNARTDYGTAITGVFANGIGFGTFQQAFRQSYVTTYSLPLLRRYATSTRWTRLLGGWTLTSSVGAEPQLDRALQLRQFLNNLRLSWSVAFAYNLSGATFRKIGDGQLAQEAALSKVTDHAAIARDALLKRMAARVEALESNPPVRDTRLASLRELYPQFELYRARYRQANSCEERMEHFFTMKGLALSLLTLAGYDRPNVADNDLLGAWKKARYATCETHSANAAYSVPVS